MGDTCKLIFLVLVLSVEPAFAVMGQPNHTRDSSLSQRDPEREFSAEDSPPPMRGAASGLAAGIWGGDHIRLDVTPQGATVEFDCAHGTISQGILVDRRGRFVVDGTYAEEHGGPVRADERVGSNPVRFTGRLKGKRMTLTVRRRDTKQLVGSFALLYGQEGALVKCR